MATAATFPTDALSRATYSCIRCADRKVKCDRKTPCSACIRHSVTCVYNANPPPRNRHKRAKEQILLSRLKQYEGLLREKGVNPSELPDVTEFEPIRKSASNDATASVGEEEVASGNGPALPTQTSPAGSVNKAEVIKRRGHFKFVENILWTGVVKEFHELGDALGDSSNDDSDEETCQDDFDLVFSPRSKAGLRSHHPSPKSIHRLWDSFVDNVDPLTKVIHVPTVRPAVEKAASNLNDVPRSFEALMFAIYGAAVMSMDNDECLRRLGAPRKILLERYISGTKKALSRAGLMGTTSLVVLQALVLHILTIRDISKPRAVWSLTGVAIRIAQSMGLDHDGVQLGLTPFETEMRRRVWWALKLHDFRTAELCGIDKFRDLDVSASATKQLANVNDDQLYPGMSSPPIEPSSSTDAIFVSVKCELQIFAASRVASIRRQGDPSLQCELQTTASSPAEVDRSSKEIGGLLETKYLRYCDPSQPLDLMAMIMSRCALNVICFLSYHPRRWNNLGETPDSERQLVWDVCLKLLEQHNVLRSNPLLKQFAWHGPYFQQWHAIIHVLDTLRRNSSTRRAERAWKLIGDTYEYTSDMASDMRKPIHVAVGNLCLQAYDCRKAVLREHGMPEAPEPGFIKQLRQHRENKKSKNQSKESGSITAKFPGEDRLSVRTDRAPVADLDVGNTDHFSVPSDNFGSTASNLPSLHLSHNIDDMSESDPFWFTRDFLDNQPRASKNNYMMNLDAASTMYANCNSMEGVDDMLNWNEWDAWLADSNLVGPLSSEEEVWKNNLTRQ